MSEILAKCPHCSTSFSVTTDQLAIADGNVRCGVCMKVFRAATNTPAPQQAGKESVADKISNTDNIEEWIKKNQGNAPVSSSGMQSGLVTAPADDEATEAFNFADDISDDFLDIKPAAAPGTPEFTEAPPEGLSLVSTDEEEQGEEAEAVPAYAAQLENAKQFDEKLSNAASEGRDPVHHHEIKTKIDVDDLDIGEDAFSNDFENNPFAIDVEDEAFTQVELNAQAYEEPETILDRYGNTGIWAGLSTTMALLLVIQVLISGFNEYAIDPELRAFYSPFCKISICELPPQEDVGKIRGSNLIVRTHPHQAQALIVDTIVNNRAAFSQKLPIIQLSFSDIQGSVIASRKFKPSEYLSNELKTLKKLPSHTPIHLSLEIADPGAQAVSYHMDFLPNV